MMACDRRISPGTERSQTTLICSGLHDASSPIFLKSHARQATTVLAISSEICTQDCHDVSCSLIFSDASGRCLHINQSCSEITGLDFLQCCEYGWAHTIHEEDLSRVLTDWFDFVKNGRIFKVEYRLNNFLRGNRRVVCQALQIRKWGQEDWNYLFMIRGKDAAIAQSLVRLPTRRPTGN